MSLATAQKISQHQLLRSLIYRKYLDIIVIISLIVLCSFLLRSHFLKSFYNLKVINVSDDTPLNVFQQPVHQANMTTSSVPQLKVKQENPLTIKLKTIFNCRDIPLREEKLQYGEYWLIKNYIRGRKSINMGCAESITYTTNGDYTFMANLPTVVERWLAPISFAIYAPGDDYDATMDSIQYARNCLPQSELIRDYVTFHIFFPKNHLPSFIAKSEEEALDWAYDCELPDVPYANVNRSKMYKTLKNLTYPINVARNIARKTVNTYFIFACDIELYPSLGLVGKFLQMVAKNSTAVLEGKNPKVFALPVFEVKENSTLPNNKEELQLMLNKSLAIPFHKFVCSNCHLVPKQQQWLEANNSEELNVFTVGKRYNPFRSWEPFYISDNKEPIFDERVTWEGQSNKRVQNYAMCLLDYEYHVLHPAFLVHAPGIKVLNVKAKETKIRMKYAAAMNNVINQEILPEYKVLYGENMRCGI